MNTLRNGSEFKTKSKKNAEETQRAYSISNSEFSVPQWRKHSIR